MKIAGGMLGLEPVLVAREGALPLFMREPRTLFLSARCGIKFLIDYLKPAQVWMPSYLCCSMIEAVDPAVSELKFFQVGYDLEIGSLDWLDQLLPGDLVVIIDYFGFSCEGFVITKAQARGAYVLEDASQALLSSHVGIQADFVIYSPRKTVGVSDGGILKYKKEYELPAPVLFSPPEHWWIPALESVIDRREFDKHGGERRWYELFRRLEDTYPLGPYRMSELSEVLLKNGFDYSAIAEARRANYECLAQSLSDFAIFKNLDEDTVPMGFPIRLKQRDVARQTLFEHDIYPPIHWQIGDCVPPQFADSHRLSADIMTVPCDQRLSLEDTMRIADLVRKVSGRL